MKNYKETSKRIVASALALASLLSCLLLASCGGEKNPNVTDPAVTTEAPVTTDPCPIAEEDFDSHEVLILEAFFSNGGSMNNFDPGDSATVLEEAIFRRNSALEERLNVTITTEEKTCVKTDGSEEGYGTLQKEKTAGDCNYDFAVLPAYDQSRCAYNGLNYDLYSVPNLNVTKEWWDQQSVNDLTIKGLLFFMTGDFSVDTFDSTVVMAFNKKLAEDKGVNDLYQLVTDGKWTMAKWMEYSRLYSEDLNGDNRMTGADLFGSIIWDDTIYAVINAVGESCCKVDDNGNLVLTFGTERIISAYEEYTVFGNNSDYVCRYQKDYKDGLTNLASLMFPNNQGLFFFSTLGSVQTFRDMEMDYGILPCFKYDEAQESYYNCVAPYNARFLCMPVNQEDVERSGKILEAIGYYSNKIITNAYYQRTLYGQTVRDEESLPMLELIRVTRKYDIGYFYQPANINKNMITLFRAANKNWASAYAKVTTSANKKLDEMNSAFDKLAEEWKNG